MKKLLIIFILFAPFVINAQEPSEDNSPADTIDVDTLNIKLKVPSVMPKKDKGDVEPEDIQTSYLFLELGLSIVNDESQIEVEDGIEAWELKPIKSTHVGINLFRQRVNLISHHVNLEYGLGFDFYKYFFEENVFLRPNDPEFILHYNTNPDVEKRRLSWSSLTLPLLLHFDTNPLSENSFNFAAGVYGGLRLGANFKTKTDDVKIKYKDDFHINDWHYGVRAEIGLKGINLYGTYAFQQLLDSDDDGGHEVYPLTFGIRFGGIN